MPQQESLFDSLGLLDQARTPSAPRKSQPRVSTSASDLDVSRLSDAELQNLLNRITGEVQERFAKERGHRPELEAEIRGRSSALSA